MTLRPWRRPGPIRVALYIADRALRADIADACEEADIAVAAPSLIPSPASAGGISIDPPPLAGEGKEGEGADVALADRPIEIAVPLILLGSGDSRKTWPANVRAVVPPDMDAATLVAIITVVAAGYALAPRSDLGGSANDMRRVANAWTNPIEAADELGGALTAREREVLALLVEGASNKEIARALALSVHTVKFHIASLTEKLGARSRVEAAAIAVRAGLAMV